MPVGTVVRRQPAVGVTYAPKRAPSPLHRSVLSSDKRTEIYLCMRSSSQVSFFDVGYVQPTRCWVCYCSIQVSMLAVAGSGLEPPAPVCARRPPHAAPLALCTAVASKKKDVPEQQRAFAIKPVLEQVARSFQKIMGAL